MTCWAIDKWIFCHFLHNKETCLSWLPLLKKLIALLVLLNVHGKSFLCAQKAILLIYEWDLVHNLASEMLMHAVGHGSQVPHKKNWPLTFDPYGSNKLGPKCNFGNCIFIRRSLWILWSITLLLYHLFKIGRALFWTMVYSCKIIHNVAHIISGLMVSIHAIQAQTNPAIYPGLAS